MPHDPILIGPIGAGKSTISTLLAEALDFPKYSLDELRYSYYNELGYDAEHADIIHEMDGFSALYEYWKPFEAHAVKRLLSDYSDCVFDFGAGHTVYDNPKLFNSVQTKLNPYTYVILLLPSADPKESIRILSNRILQEPKREVSSDILKLNEYFVHHPSNHRLSTDIVYTKNKSPTQVCDTILLIMERAV